MTPSLDGAVLRERMRDLVPDLAAQAPEAEQLRRPTDASIRALEESGVFRMMVPACYGGLELDLDAFVDVGLELARSDTSIAWVTTFCIEHNWMFCQFPESFQRELYRDRQHVLAPAVINPTGGSARREGEGFRLSGRWQWGTGAMHASWAIVGGLIEGAEGPEGLRFFALPIEDLTVDDTWYVDGMVATGSNDLVVEDAWVPDERTVNIPQMVEGRAPGSRIHEGPLYRTPMIPILLLAASMPVVGQARAVVDGFRDRLHGHGRMALGKGSDRVSNQMRLGRVTVAQQQAELVLRDTARQVMALRNDAKLLDRSRWAASVTSALHESRRVILDVAEASGASAHFQTHPLQRAVRDANVASCHVAFDRDAQTELLGKLLLGLEVGPALI
jgi:alkylation response protein AidB-like acyl-CoA dehydrogenase